ncbi:hypothetical protein WN48_01794 [Eufriesea mexicana]|uniref:Uncharacterized protein n=1 Tax=Eufriesea mexicana TaxID=516756 RepID=A0A310SUN0_9HYME|nr:hypothetical protein WN48_01794 [Eufriesea mexicana]
MYTQIKDMEIKTELQTALENYKSVMTERVASLKIVPCEEHTDRVMGECKGVIMLSEVTAEVMARNLTVSVTETDTETYEQDLKRIDAKEEILQCGGQVTSVRESKDAGSKDMKQFPLSLGHAVLGPQHQICGKK